MKSSKVTTLLFTGNGVGDERGLFISEVADCLAVLFVFVSGSLFLACVRLVEKWWCCEIEFVVI
jgi:hypothetical protein